MSLGGDVNQWQAMGGGGNQELAAGFIICSNQVKSYPLFH